MLEMKLLMHAKVGNLFCKKLLMGWWGKNTENLSSLPLYFEAHKELFDFLNLQEIPRCIG
jgi:hypothetical protein